MRRFSWSPRFLAFALVAIPLGIAALAAPVATQTGCSSDPVIPPSDPPIIIGATAALSGDQQVLGQSTQELLRVAESHLNAVGGILGRRVVIDVRDDEGKSASVSAVVAKLLADRPEMVGFIGPSTGLQTVRQQFFDRKILIISPLSTAPNISTLEPTSDGGTGGRYTFRTGCLAKPQLRAMAKFAFAGNGGTGPGPIDAGPEAGPKDAGTSTGPKVAACKRMAIIHQDDDGGTGNEAAKILTDAFTALGGTVVGDFKITGSEASFKDALIPQVIAANPECQALLTFAKPGGTYMQEFKAAAKTLANIPTYGEIPLYTPDFLKFARADVSLTSGPTAAENVIGTACDQERTTQQDYNTFDNIYRTYYPVNDASLSKPVPQVFDSVMLLALAVEQAKSSTDRVAIRDSLLKVSRDGEPFNAGKIAEAINAIKSGRDINYECASGSCDFDEFGDVKTDLIIWQVQNAALVTLETIKSSDLN